jgi:hypothetical protein
MGLGNVQSAGVQIFNVPSVKTRVGHKLNIEASLNVVDRPTATAQEIRELSGTIKIGNIFKPNRNARNIEYLGKLTDKLIEKYKKDDVADDVKAACKKVLISIHNKAHPKFTSRSGLYKDAFPLGLAVTTVNAIAIGVRNLGSSHDVCDPADSNALGFGRNKGMNKLGDITRTISSELGLYN